MLKFDDLDSFVSPSVQGISQLEQFMYDYSLSDDDIDNLNSDDFQFITLFQLEVKYLKSIVFKVHYTDFKKTDCAKSLRTIIELLKKCHDVNPEVLALQIVDSFVDLVDCLSELYSSHLDALDQFSNINLSDRKLGVFWPYTVQTIELCAVLIGDLFALYDVIKHEPLPVSVDRIVNIFIDKLESLLEQRYVVLDRTTAYAELLMGLETFRFKSAQFEG